jgi:hypothetical protein
MLTDAQIKKLKPHRINIRLGMACACSIMPKIKRNGLLTISTQASLYRGGLVLILWWRWRQRSLCRDDAKQLREQGINPKAHHEGKIAIDDSVDTFKAIASEWLGRQNYAPSNIDKAKWLLEFTYVASGRKPIDQITPVMVLKAYRSLRKRIQRVQKRGYKVNY